MREIVWWPLSSHQHKVPLKEITFLSFSSTNKKATNLMILGL